MLYDIRKPLYVTIDGEHHDTLRQDYPGCFSYFANHYGLVRWSDTTTPRTNRPVRFVGRDRAWGALGMPFTYRPDSPCPKCGIVRFPA